MKIGYIRVSTVEQNTERQYKALEKYNIETYYTEKISGKSRDRKELNEMLKFARKGDTIYIADFSRLARNTKDLLSIIEECNKKGIVVISDKEKLDTSSATGKLMLTMIAAIAEFERNNLLERQREGIAIAKEKGKYKGRKKIEIDDSTFHYWYKKYQHRVITKTQMAKELNISRPTLDKLIKEHSEKENADEIEYCDNNDYTFNLDTEIIED